MAGLFGPGTDLAVKVGIVVFLEVLMVGAGWWFLAPRTDYATAMGWVMDQPVPFSHEHHVSGLGLDCRFCHTSVEKSATAGMPTTDICMTCHSQIWTNAEMLAPVRESFTRHAPIVWNRVNTLPDYVYFNHAIHVAKGVGCSSCHGDVARMPLTSKAEAFHMSFCLDCHRNPGPRLRPPEEMFDTSWHRTPETPAPEALLVRYHVGDRNLADCSICHR
jgi:hypothetical protein